MMIFRIMEFVFFYAKSERSTHALIVLLVFFFLHIFGIRSSTAGQQLPNCAISYSRNNRVYIWSYLHQNLVIRLS